MNLLGKLKDCYLLINTSSSVVHVEYNAYLFLDTLSSVGPAKLCFLNYFDCCFLILSSLIVLVLLYDKYYSQPILFSMFSHNSFWILNKTIFHCLAGNLLSSSIIESLSCTSSLLIIPSLVITSFTSITACLIKTKFTWLWFQSDYSFSCLSSSMKNLSSSFVSGCWRNKWRILRQSYPNSLNLNPKMEVDY